MRRTLALKVLPALCAGLAVALVVPGFASADTLDAYKKGVLPDSVGFNTLWVIVAGMVVMFMQCGFMFLEIGFSRQKNAGTIVAKILTNFSIAAVMWYLCGFAFAFASPVHGLDGLIGGTGFLLQGFGDPTTAFPVMGLSNATVESKFFF
ncbi:MAG: ammonium transporter, Amt family, partial [Gaiellaceae bacterium]|nr:ammonium transporter, Amt family [Gaiellaceae bacterium]